MQFSVIIQIIAVQNYTQKDYCSFENGPICAGIPHIACSSNRVMKTLKI